MQFPTSELKCALNKSNIKKQNKLLHLKYNTYSSLEHNICRKMLQNQGYVIVIKMPTEYRLNRK